MKGGVPNFQRRSEHAMGDSDEEDSNLIVNRFLEQQDEDYDPFPEVDISGLVKNREAIAKRYGLSTNIDLRNLNTSGIIKTAFSKERMTQRLERVSIEDTMFYLEDSREHADILYSQTIRESNKLAMIDYRKSYARRMFASARERELALEHQNRELDQERKEKIESVRR